MRITIFGATGLLGKALTQECGEDEVTGFSSADGDIRDDKEVSGLVGHSRPDWIILAAAYTNVDGCESDRDLAFDVNCHGAVNVARAAREHGARLLFLSTDYVFDGRKTTPYETNDARAPHSVYGQSKAEAEVQISVVLPESCIVRTSWLFGDRREMFSRHNPEGSGQPSTTRSGWRSARLSDLHRGPGSRHHSTLPQASQWNCPCHQPG